MRFWSTFIVGLWLTLSVTAERADALAKHLQEFVVADAASIAIQGIRVIPGDGAPALESQTVLIRDGRIEAVGHDLPVPADATVVDGSGLTALPGLVMLHEHLFYPADRGQMGHYGDLQPIAFPRLYLAHGVTRMRTAGAVEPINELQIRRAISEGRQLGPEIDITAPFLEGPGSFFQQAEPIETPEEARRIVRFWAAQGATSFKAYNFISREVLAAAIDEAHQHNLRVTGHLCSVTFAEAAEMGIDNLEHGLNSATDFVEGKTPDQCKFHDAAGFMAEVELNSEPIRALIRQLVDADVALTSTLAVFADLGTGAERPTPAALESLSEGARARYQAMKGRVSSPRNEVALRKEMAFQRAFVDAGGLLVAGTDPTGIGGVIAGFGTLWQVELLVEAGFTPLEAIRISTYNGARYLDELEEIGTLEPGKRADLVLVRGRPDENITDLRALEIVFKGGVGYDSKALIKSVTGLVGR